MRHQDDSRRAGGALPDFVGIGALKAGTSYLDAMFRTHPGLSLPLHLKEVDFFSRHYQRGTAWYAGQFATADGRPRGEFSPRYFNDRLCPERIAAANPLAKLVISVRNPIARALSQHRHWAQETSYLGDFETFLREHPGVIERSKYWQSLQPYRAVFPDEQFKVVVFEDIVTEPLPVLQDLFAYVGADDSHVPTNLDRAVNVSGVPRFPRLYARSKSVSRWLYDRGAGTSVERSKATRLARTLRGSDRLRWSAQNAPPALPMDPQIKATLQEQFRSDAAALSDWLGRDLVAIWGLRAEG